jgi:hypothetical protein
MMMSDNSLSDLQRSMDDGSLTHLDQEQKSTALVWHQEPDRSSVCRA